MIFDDLARLPEEPTGTCHDCGVKLTEENRTQVEQIRDDGKLQGLCQNCYRADDVMSLEEFAAKSKQKEAAPTPPDSRPTRPPADEWFDIHIHRAGWLKYRVNSEGFLFVQGIGGKEVHDPKIHNFIRSVMHEAAKRRRAPEERKDP